jgi:hypothetical protein
MYDNNKRHLFRVTRTPVDPSRFSWLNKPRVRYGSHQMAIQTYVYSKFDNPKKYDVTVELLEVKELGEIDMEKYRKRNKIETFLK